MDEDRPVHSVRDTVSNALTRSPVPLCLRSTFVYRYSPNIGLMLPRNELEIYTIRERLDQICDLLSLRLASSFAMPPNAPGIKLPRFDDYPLDESIISRNWRVEFPFMTIQTPSMMCSWAHSATRCSNGCSRANRLVHVDPTRLLSWF
jgi:hypothetical protein